MTNIYIVFCTGVIAVWLVLFRSESGCLALSPARGLGRPNDIIKESKSGRYA